MSGSDLTPLASGVHRRDLLKATVLGTTLATSGVHADAAMRPAGDDTPPQMLPVTLMVNGRANPVTLDSRTTLLDALRNHVGLTGSKKGCDHGQCRACTVLVGGKRTLSCLTLAAMVREPVTTI